MFNTNETLREKMFKEAKVLYLGLTVAAIIILFI